MDEVDACLARDVGELWQGLGKGGKRENKGATEYYIRYQPGNGRQEGGKGEGSSLPIFQPSNLLFHPSIHVSPDC